MDNIEDDEFVASEHDRLISAVSKFDKTQHITEPTRNEPTNLNSEFNLIKASKKLDLDNVVKVLGDTAHHVQISKKLRKSQDLAKVLPKPLEKPQVERIKRSTGYEETKERVGRWDPVVARARTVDYVSFPIKSASYRNEPTVDFLSKLKSKSSLEMELDEVDPPVMQEVEEDEPKYPMSYEEMVEHRQHTAKIRALQSYKAAKAKRQGKIKSKKYHRILKKDRLKLQLKEFEELQQKDPEEALKKLEAIEKQRAVERHTLRHKSTGKWAKSQLIRAKYDKDVRQQLAEQLSISRKLTHKNKDDSTDDEGDEQEKVPNVTLLQDPMNPWMVKRSDKSNVNEEFDFGYKKYLNEKTLKCKADSGTDSDEVDELEADSQLDVLKASLKSLRNSHCSDEESKAVSTLEENEKKIIDKSNKLKLAASIPVHKKENNKATKRSKLNQSIQQPNKVIATSSWVVESSKAVINPKISKPKTNENVDTAFETLETKLSKEIGKKLQTIRAQIENLEKDPANKKIKKKGKTERDNLEYFKLKNMKIKPIVDEELIETGSKTVTIENIERPLSKVLNAPAQESLVDTNIDPSRFIQAKPKYLNTALSNAGAQALDQLDDDDEQVVPKVNIEEVFEEDDVVASFRQEKEDEINKEKPEDIKLGLPGWGSWGGKGVKAPRRKRNRFILKAPPVAHRRDENKGDIIIKEYKEPKLASHKVTDVPFPFTSVKQYEASIRAPIGNTFVPEKAFKKLIKPSVFTKAGTIIEPMDEDELLVPRNKRFRNENIISLLGKNK